MAGDEPVPPPEHAGKRPGLRADRELTATGFWMAVDGTATGRDRRSANLVVAELPRSFPVRRLVFGRPPSVDHKYTIDLRRIISAAGRLSGARSAHRRRPGQRLVSLYTDATGPGGGRSMPKPGPRPSSTPSRRSTSPAPRRKELKTAAGVSRRLQHGGDKDRCPEETAGGSSSVNISPGVLYQYTWGRRTN